MRTSFRGAVAAVAILFLFVSQTVNAFSLLGPYASWMTTNNGYRVFNDVGGPMSLNSEYRWNVPVVTYAFDQSFLNYFGTNGVAAVESAIAILNNLPPASQLNASNFPPDSRQVNFAAASQSLVDLKSAALYLLVEQLGLASPSRYTAALHGFSITGDTINGIVVQRNFDPFSLAPTNGVNGVQYAYTLYLAHSNPDSVNWWVFPVDPLGQPLSAVADGYPSQSSNPGYFFTGLTRDDVGGLRYLLQTNNFNFETLLPDVHGTGTNSVNYANAVARAGVDKVTFVRLDYDLLSGLATVPLTNHFVDTYVTNSSIVHQQLERVISKPDIIFSAFSGEGHNVAFRRTGTTNWLNESINLEGPGIIRPGVTIAFQKFGLNASAQTADNLAGATIESTRWASFDASTNAPIIYPVGITSGQVSDFQVNLSLYSTNFTAPNFTWHLLVAYGDSATLQTSANLRDWVSQGKVTNYGMQLDWSHFCTVPQGFFRVIPDTSSP